MIEGQKVVQAFGHEAESLAAFDEVNGQLQDVSLKAIFFSSLTNPATRFVNNMLGGILNREWICTTQHNLCW